MQVNRMTWKFLWACLACLPLLAKADDDGDEVGIGNVKFTRLSQSVHVNADFSYDEERDFEFKALSEEGARQNIRNTFSYNKAFSTLEILIAETIKADGRHIPVPASGIARQSGSVQFYTFRDLETLSLALPDFMAGDSAHIVVRTHTQPYLPGSFNFTYSAIQSIVQENSQFSLDMPASMRLLMDVQGIPVVQDERHDGRRKLVWRYVLDKPKPGEPAETDTRLTQPHVWLSTFESWDALARAYAPLYETSSGASPELSAFAQKLVEGAGSDREKISRIYDWVRHNIHYVAIYSGMENWVPHPVTQIFADRYGDCKDHALILGVMLKAIGIDSVPVLIQNDTVNYALPGVANTSAFNHMISYLPEQDLYLDSTATYAMLGSLPDSDQGKQVLRIGLPQVVGSTPMSPSAARQSRRSTQIKVNADGSAEVTTTLWFGGDFRNWYDAFRQQFSKGEEKAWANRLLTGMNKRGSASLVWLPDEAGQHGLRITEKIDNYLSDSEIGLLDFGHAYVGVVSLYPVLDTFERKRRKTSFSCMPLDVEDTVQISLPDNLRLLRLPHDKDLDNDVARLHIAYTTEDGHYIMQRSFRWQPASQGSCSAADWSRWEKTMRQMRSAVKSGVLAYER
jgi:hypothetical protein